MANAKKLMKAAAIIFAAALTISCTKSNNYGEEMQPTTKTVIIEKDDELVDIRLDTLQTVKNAQRVITVTPVEIWKGAKGTKEVAQKAYTLTRDLRHEGVPTQYFEPKAFEYETSRKSASYAEGKAEPVDDNFTVVAVDSTVVFEAVNAENETIETSVKTGSEFVAFSLFSEKLNRTISVEFRPLTWTLEEKTSHKDVTNVAYKGNVWDAVEYSSNVVANFSLGGKKEVTNLAYLLKHKIDVDIDKEKIGYEVEIKEGELKLYKDPQTVSFELVTKDNGKEVARIPYAFEETFEIVASPAAQNKTLESEDAIKAVKATFSKGEIKSEESTKDICSLTISTFEDVITVSDGNVFNVKGIFEALGWNGHDFGYASTTDARTAELTMSKNGASTSAHVVYDMRLTLSYPIVYNNTNKESETKSIVITWQDDCYVNGSSLDVKDFVLDYQQPAADTMSTKVQYYTAHHYEANNGKVVDEDIKRDLNMGARLTRVSGAQVQVESFDEVTVSVVPDGADKTSYSKRDEKLGLVAEKVSTSYRVLVSNKETGKVLATYRLTVADEKDLRNGADFGHHASFNKGTIKASVKPANVAATATSRAVEVSVDLPVERTDRTKAAGEETSFTLSASHVEVRKGHARDTIYTRVGNDIEVTLKSYRTEDGKKGEPYQTLTKKISGSYKGQAGSRQPVKSVENFTATKAAFTAQSANGTNEVTAVNATDAVKSVFVYDYTPSVEFTDDEGTVSIKASMEISGIYTPSHGTGSTEGQYTVYPYTCGSTATLTCGTASVDLPATATATLEVANKHNRRLTYIAKADKSGFDVRHEAWYEGSNPYKDETKTVPCGIKGIDDAKQVSTVSGLQTTFAGLTATASTTATASATNGKANDDFAPKFQISMSSVTFTDDEGSFVVAPELIINANGSQNLGSGNASAAEVVYPYSFTVNGTFTCGDASMDVTATSNWKLTVPVEIETIIGNLASAACSVVPAHKEGNGFAWSSGQQFATETITFVKKDGTAATFVFALEEEVNADNAVSLLPSDGQLQSAKWWNDRTYSSEYNSAMYLGGEWHPAVAIDENWGIHYVIRGRDEQVSVRNETLNKMWHWRGGNLSTVSSNYKAEVKDGVCTIYYKDNVVKRFK